ncbi:MAG: hypothetical protein M3Q65_01940 [Chloroflexota bacterium]|nr:hypothetical protein [Chloroflexota bacterium]
MDRDIPAIRVAVETIYGARHRQPFVSLRFGDRKPDLLTPEKAREIGAMLNDAAAAAEVDAFLVEFLVGTGMELRDAATILDEFRKWREAREGRDGE